MMGFHMTISLLASLILIFLFSFFSFHFVLFHIVYFLFLLFLLFLLFPLLTAREDAIVILGTSMWFWSVSWPTNCPVYFSFFLVDQFFFGLTKNKFGRPKKKLVDQKHEKMVFGWPQDHFAPTLTLAVFIVLWSCIFTNKLRYLPKNNRQRQTSSV